MNRPTPPSHSRRCLIVVFVFAFVILTTATRRSQKRRCHRNYTQPKETPTAQIRHPTLFTQALPSLVTRPPILTVRCSARGHGARTGAMQDAANGLPKISLLGRLVNRRAATYVYPILNRTFTDPLQLAGSRMLRFYLEGRGGPW